MTGRGKRNSRRGSTMIEFSLSFVGFVLLLIALVEIGRAVWTLSSLNQATLAAVRFATVHGSGNPILNNGDDETALAIEQLVQQQSIGLKGDLVEVVTEYAPNNDPGGLVIVTAAYPMAPITRLFFRTGTFNITTTATGVVMQ